MCSVVFRTYIYSNRPKEIIDGLDLADKVMGLGPRVSPGLLLKDIAGPETAKLITTNKAKVDFACALT